MPKNIKKRLSVALFMAGLGSRDSYFWNIWMGVHDAARKLDINLYTITGSSVQLSDMPDYQVRSRVYDLISTQSVDGIILGIGVLPMLTVEQMRL